MPAQPALVRCLVSKSLVVITPTTLPHLGHLPTWMSPGSRCPCPVLNFTPKLPLPCLSPSDFFGLPAMTLPVCSYELPLLPPVSTTTIYSYFPPNSCFTMLIPSREIIRPPTVIPSHADGICTWIPTETPLNIAPPWMTVSNMIHRIAVFPSSP